MAGLPSQIVYGGWQKIHHTILPSFNNIVLERGGNNMAISILKEITYSNWQSFRSCILPVQFFKIVER